MPTPKVEVPPGDYAAEWAIIDSLEQQGLFKSALEHVDVLYTRAKADKKMPQVIKSLLFRGKYATFLEEDGLVNAVRMFEEEEKSSRQPQKAVLQSVLGQLYSAYLNNQRWRIRDRTPVPDGEGGDILTWSAAQLERRALDYYAASVYPYPILLDTDVASFRDILTPGKGDTLAGEPLRPVLYDLLAHRALEFFGNERSYLMEPAYKFYLDQPEAFAPLSEFMRARFETRDSTSGKWLAINLFQKLLNRQKSITLTPGQPEKVSVNTAALVADDLLRLQFAKNNSVLEDKLDRYVNALELLHKTHYNHPADAEIVYQLAQAWLEQDNQRAKSDGALLKRAASECEDAIRRHPGTFGASQCAGFLANLRRRSLGLDVEKVVMPGRPVLLSVSLKNVPKVWVKVVAVPNDPDKNFQQMEWDQRLAYLNGLPAMQQVSWDVKDPGDYHQHRTELRLRPMPEGHYVVLVATAASFSDANEAVSFAPFTCSMLAGIALRQEGANRFAVVHRESGQPLLGIQADFFEQRWNSGQRAYERVYLGQTQSDREGMVVADVPPSKNFQVRFSRGNDTLWLEDQYSHYEREQPYRPREVQFFTDRSLYRPGQTVYFKGVVFQRDDREYPKIAANTPVLVKFLDANYQIKNQLTLRTNEFGTFNGAFTAPASGLTGQMHIEADGFSGAAWFNVEEYKRPRFEVTFKPLEGAYRVNETVTLRGEAKNYAGSSVDGAQVRYRVVRQARFPWWDWWGWNRPIYPTETMEIANGVVSTGPDGSFQIQFTALPDRAIPKKDQPMFDYSVTADVTDITGETHSSQTNLSAGYVALNVDLGLPGEIPLDSLRQVALNTTNTSGQFQAASGVITMQRLLEPRRLFVRRYWENPDVLTLAEADFRRDFPAYAWKEEDNPENWDRQDASRPIAFNTASSKKVDLHGGQAAPGYYLVVLQTKDPFGEPIEIKRVVHVWDPRDRRTQFREPTGMVERSQCEPGETAHFWFGGHGDHYSFLTLLEREGKAQTPRWLEASGAGPVDLAVEERDRGGFSMIAFTVKNNRCYLVGPLIVTVPWSNKELTIQYETFRDKLLPGQKEEWRLRISGPKKDKVAAEMVAALYDASLDQFLPHNWSGIYFPSNYPQSSFSADAFAANTGEVRFREENAPGWPERSFPALNWFGFPLYGSPYRGNLYRSKIAMDDVAAPMAAPAEAEMAVMADGVAAGAALKKDHAVAFDSGSVPPPPPPPAPTPPAPRRNLNETVFFFQQLRTDANGDIVLKFTMNEALTRWKFLAFAHTKELRQVLSEKTVVTQKDLMVITNPPRFLREGDVIEFTAKVSNLTKEPVTGTASLRLFDAASMQPAEAAFSLGPDKQSVPFTVPAGQSAPVSWRLKVPEGGVNGLTWQIFAEGKQSRDGEENTLPVLTNRMLVTETLPIAVRGNQSKTVVFDNLKNTASGTLRTQRYTLEFTSNPAWYAVQALPYVMEFPHECTEQMFSRFYANTLASSVTKKLPNLRRVYDKWKGTDAMKSNLSKNQELKTALLEETPWVLDAQSEEQQKQNIALLFDLNRMADEQARVLAVLAERQASNGGWPWFPGGREDWYITQYIVTGFGHLDKLGAFSAQSDDRANDMWHKALRFCDSKMEEQYRELEKAVAKGEAKWEDDHLDGMVIHYLYARSFAGLDRSSKAVQYYLGQAEKYWLGKGLYQEGLLALALHRSGRTESAKKIVASLRERALQKEELGMYWPFDWGMYWYQLPVETQALMVEVFDEVAADSKSVEELRVWLLKNKQTNRWESTKATAEAVYALLLHGDNWLNNSKPVQISLGGKTLKPAEYEPGTGYFKQSWTGSEVKPSWSTIKVDNPNSNLVWGAAYWQYFEDLDKIQSFRKTPLTIVKQLYKEENSPTGPKLTALAEGSRLKPGDKLKVRIEIRVDRPMEYVHLKDMRASGFEPVNVLSGYHWQDGLGYYESTKDLATHFFIDYLPRGTFVFEYPMVVNHRGDFSNGITTIQCMYAPEFTSHSQGIRVSVD